MEYKTKEKSLKMKKLFNTAYYRLWAGKHFAYYVIGQGIEGHEVSDAKEIFSQTLMIPRVHHIRETVRKKPKIVARMSLCGSQRRRSTMTNAMKSDLPDVIQDVIQVDYWDGASSIDKSYHVLRS